MPRAGIIVYRDENGLTSARARYEIAKNAPAKIKTEAVEDFLIKKALEHFISKEGNT